MTTQSDALRLAEHLEKVWHQYEAAAELRRLARVEAQRDALRAELKEVTEAINDPAVNNLRTLAESIQMLSNQRDALLEAYRKMKNVAAGYSNLCDDSAFTRKLEREFEAADAIARAAIKAVKEGK